MNIEEAKKAAELLGKIDQIGRDPSLVEVKLVETKAGLSRPEHIGINVKIITPSDGRSAPFTSRIDFTLSPEEFNAMALLLNEKRAAKKVKLTEDIYKQVEEIK